MAVPLRLNSELIIAAKKQAAIQKRSVPKQIEYWAEIGKAIDHSIDPADVYAVIHGFKKIIIEPELSRPVNPDDVFNSIEKDRKSGRLSKKVTSSVIYYEASSKRPGLLDRVNTATGERKTGQFENGEFKIIK